MERESKPVKDALRQAARELEVRAKAERREVEAGERLARDTGQERNAFLPGGSAWRRKVAR